MSVKILGGVARGFTLATPKADSTKPTSVLIRRKIFDWRQNLEGHIFIDLCAGSGSMGLEAMSRGAEKIFLNDALRPAFLTARDNAQKFTQSFKLDPSAVKVTNLDAMKWVEKELAYEIPDSKDAILFFDPPYEDHDLYRKVLAQLKQQNFEGEVWVESDSLMGLSLEELTGVFHSVIKTVQQGDHFVLIGFLV